MPTLGRPVIAGNWKMHKGPNEARAWAETFLAATPASERTIVVFPPAATLAVLAWSLRERDDIVLGVQNIHWEAKGAFTGETSASIAAEADRKSVV